MKNKSFYAPVHMFHGIFTSLGLKIAVHGLTAGSYHKLPNSSDLATMCSSGIISNEKRF